MLEISAGLEVIVVIVIMVFLFVLLHIAFTLSSILRSVSYIEHTVSQQENEP